MFNVNNRRIRKFAIGLGLALAVSVIGVPSGNAARVQASKSGGTITVGIFDLLPTYCFGSNIANSALGAIKTVYEGLVERRKDGVIVPYLAESFASSDNQTWTIKLRSGIKFHNGEDLNTAAAILNLEAYRGTIGTTVGPHTYGSGVPFTANYAKVTAVDNLTFTIRLWRAQPDFMGTVYASGRFYMRAPEQIKSKTVCVAKPIGTGPFTFVSGDPTKTVVAKNASYWRKDAAGNALPYLDGITFSYVAEASQRANGVRSGTLDAAMFTSGGEGKQVYALQHDKNVQVIASPAEYYPFVFLNQAIEPFNNAHARLAVSYAWDVATYYKARNCVKDTCYGEIPKSIVGPLNVMFNEQGFVKYNLKNAATELALYTKDTGKALTFTIPAAESSTSLANAKAYQQILAKAGITVTINQETSAAIVTKAFPSPGTSAGNPYQFLPILLAEGTDTSFTIPFLVSSTAGDTGNMMNFTGLKPFYSLLSLTRHKNLAIDKILFDARADGSQEALKMATKAVQEAAIVMAVPSLQYFYSLSAKVKGFDTFSLASGGKGKPMTNAGINWTGVYIEK